MDEIAPGIYTESFYPGINVGFICTPGGAIAVDCPPRPADAQAWQRTITKTCGRPIRWTVLTDHHPDRLLGIGWLGAPLIAGHGTLELLLENSGSLWRSALEWWNNNRESTPGLGQAPRVMPEVAVAGHITLRDAGDIDVRAIAGAAPGSIWVRSVAQRVVFVGDTVVTGEHPLLNNTPDSRAWLRTLTELRRGRSPAQIIVPGRGAVCDKEATRPLSEYINLARRRIRSLHIAGSGKGDVDKLIAEFAALYPIPAEEEESTQQQIRDGLEHIYHEMRPEKEEE